MSENKDNLRVLSKGRASHQAGETGWTDRALWSQQSGQAPLRNGFWSRDLSAQG